MSGALDGIRVIDFGQYLAGPLAAMLLADQGAEVIRVDPPGGPRWQDPCNAVLQRGKQSLVLDLKQPGDRETAQRLVRSADVVIENFRPGVMERLGVGPRAMLEVNSGLIYCSIPGFPEDDPRAGVTAWEGVIAAAAGLYFPDAAQVGRDAGDDPVYTAAPYASSYAAFIACHSIVAALIARARGAGGQRIEAPIYDASFQVMANRADTPNARQTNQTGVANRAVGGRHLCADGRYVDISPPVRGWAWFLDHFMSQDLKDRGITDLANGDPAANAELKTALATLFKTRPAAEWERIGNDEAGTGMALCQTTAEWLQDTDAMDSRSVLALRDPEYGETLQAGYPISLSATSSETQSPRHTLDADRDAILASQERRSASATAKANGAVLQRALEGFRVIDCSQILAGPTAARILAEYGAEVIKINNPRPENPLAAMSHTYVNNGKRTILLDLKSPEGLEILWRLVDKADVFHQNFVRGVTDRLGIGESEMRRHKPDIIFSAVNTYAEGGYRTFWRGHEELGQAVTGMEVRFGGDDVPARAGWAVCDFATGHLSAFAILLALYHRQQTGEGQRVQASLSGSGTFLQVPFMVDFAGRVWDEPRGLGATGRGPLCRLYRASDRWFFLAAQRPGDRQRLETIDGLTDIGTLADEQLYAELAKRFRQASAETWVNRLNAAGLSAQVARQVRENMLEAPEQARGLSIVRNHPEAGEIRNVGKSVRLSRTPLDPLFPAPPYGWHSREIVEEVGLANRFADFIAAGVVAAPAEGVAAD